MNTKLKHVSLLKVFVSLAVVCTIAVGTARGAPPDLLVGNPSAPNVIRFDGQTGAFVEDFISTGSGGGLVPNIHGMTFFPNPCPDLDGDGTVGVSDLLTVVTAWGACVGCPEDIDGNDDVGFSDLLLVLSAWGPCE